MPPNFEVSNLAFSKTMYGLEFQRFPPKFASSKKYARQSFNFSLNIPIFHSEFMSVVAVVVQTLFITLLKIWDVARKKKTFQLLPYKN